jgi:hypothetical protein
MTRLWSTADRTSFEVFITTWNTCSWPKIQENSLNWSGLHTRTRCNRKVQTNFGHEFHIPKQEKMFISACVWKHLICELSLKEYIISAQNVLHEISARCDTSHHGPPNPCKDAGVVADSLTGIHNAMVSASSLSAGAVYTRVVGGPTEDANPASVEAMQWVLLCLSIDRNRCYWEHLAQHG